MKTEEQKGCQTCGIEDRWEKTRWSLTAFLGTLALQTFEFHIERPHRQRSHHPVTTAFPGQMPSARMKTLWRWTQLSPDYTSWGTLRKTNSSIRHGQPTDLWAKELVCFKVICFSEIINQNNVQPLIQDFAFEISSHILYPIIKSLQFLKDPNLLKWPINSDCEFHHLIPGSVQHFPDLCLPFTARSKASLQATFEGFWIITTYLDSAALGEVNYSKPCPSHTEASNSWCYSPPSLGTAVPCLPLAMNVPGPTLLDFNVAN